ncbi:MAG: hypothetical protein KDD66_15705 [Bdellovibrionales bacterium]|nr:hypothetical protein [Bdellovibrionales bacterium]
MKFVNAVRHKVLVTVLFGAAVFTTSPVYARYDVDESIWGPSASCSQRGDNWYRACVSGGRSPQECCRVALDIYLLCMFNKCLRGEVKLPPGSGLSCDSFLAFPGSERNDLCEASGWF